jgi:hypothetical protein
MPFPESRTEKFGQVKKCDFPRNSMRSPGAISLRRLDVGVDADDDGQVLE